MNRKADEHITRDVAREICERDGIKAMLLGLMAKLGNNYVLTLEALNPQTVKLWRENKLRRQARNRSWESWERRRRS